MVWVIACILITCAILYKNKDFRTKIFKTDPSKIGLTDPKILIVFGLLVFNLVSWAMIPWFWGILHYNWYTLLFFNIGMWTVLFLRTIKEKDTSATASKLSSFISILLVLGLGTTVASKYELEKRFYSETNNPPTYQPVVTSSNAVYSPITGKLMPPQPVADAESGTCGVLGSAKQFLPGTKTPVRNPQNGNPGTGAVGYWGINLSSPAVKSLVENYKVDGKSLDVENNKDHNDAAASLLYEESGLRPWIASKHCWGDKIYGYLAQQPLPYVLDVVSVPVGTWSEEVKNPLINGAKLRWGKLDDYKGGSCKVRFDKNDQKVFLIESSTLNLYPGTLQFQCAEEGAEIRVRVVPK